ncbi:uncharacterized protein LOC113372707 [Ctenocephalides felis]|uniref:uncharacterized protein LOC113372707 n=1 Tax=Ctenocephalides felis TaxID=7515 RepID=UPI000E6E1A27|nr:uncharacterized protein LOC113372707 [Ctenocephalides felis]
MEFDTLQQYRIFFWSGDIDDDRMYLESFNPNGSAEKLYYHSAMVMTTDRKSIYCCTMNNCYQVSHYQLSEDSQVWTKVEDLPRTDNDVTEMMLQLKFDKNDTILLASTNNGFVVWDLGSEKSDGSCVEENSAIGSTYSKISENAIQLKLPHGVRNITMKMLQSNSIMLSAHKDYAVAGVRKNLYVWSLPDGNLVKSLDAHFGRIMQLESLTIGNWNSVITSSIDRTVKVWNINNIFEQVHVIDRHELQIDSISLSQEAGIAVTVTRACIGVWDLKTGRLLSKLADSPLGAIVTHAEITPNGKYVVSAESGNFIIWDRVTERVTHKARQPDIRQVSLHLDPSGQNICALAVSRPGNAPGCDVTRVPAQAVMRSVPDGTVLYSFQFQSRSVTGVPFRPLQMTSDNQHILAVMSDKNNKDCLAVFSAKDGTGPVQKIGVRNCGIKEITRIVGMPHKAHLAGVLGSDKGVIVDIRNKRILRTVPKWGGSCTKDGKHGLYYPARGGLELIELRKGQTVKTYIPKVAEGVFTIICMFNKTEDYVLYYHSGKKTLRVFRTEDTNLIATYRVQAELSAIASTEDGRAVVLGTSDGCLSVLAIADPNQPHVTEYLASLPSRDEQWKKKLEKLKAAARFKAAAKIAKLSAKFISQDDVQEEDPADILNSDMKVI